MADRVRETTTKTGTGTAYNLDGAVSGFVTAVAGIGDGLSDYFVIDNGADFEIITATVTDASPDTLTRTAIHKSSNADAAVNWGAGTKNVYHDLPKAFFDRVALKDVAQTFTGSIRPASTTLTAASNVFTPNFTATNDIEFTLGSGAASTLANDTGIVSGEIGQTGEIKISQNGTTAGTIAFGSYFKTSANTTTAFTHTMNTTLGAVDTFVYKIVATNIIAMTFIGTSV